MKPSLANLLSTGRPATQIVAWRQGAPKRFDEFRRDVASVAASTTGVRRAALICGDSYAFAVGFFALLQIGAEIVLPHNAQPLALKGLSGEFDRVLGDEVLKCPYSDPSFEALDPEGCKIDFFTSGSTGQPKRVGKTLGMLEREIATYDAIWAAAPTHATVTHQHLYGLTFRLLWPIYAGHAFSAETHEVWETLLAALTPNSILISSPAHLSRLGGLDPLPENRRPNQVFSAGAPLPVSAAQETKRIFGCLPTEIFGSTETGAFATRCQTTEAEPWGLLPGNEMQTDAAGNLHITSPYAPISQATGDLVERVEGGFRFVGRADRVVKNEGKRISLLEVEAALGKSPWVEQAAVILLPSNPPQLVAAIVPSAEGNREIAAIGKFWAGRALSRALAEGLGPAGAPRRWRFVTALPTGAMGKVADQQIAALFEEGA